MALIALRNMTKIYPAGNQNIAAVQELNLFIKAGEFAVLAGPSGSGKTTVLNIVGALDRATEGAVAVDGIDYNEMKPRQLAEFRLKRIGFGTAGAFAVVLATVGVSRLKPAPPAVERSTVWIDTIFGWLTLARSRGSRNSSPKSSPWRCGTLMATFLSIHVSCA